MLAQYVILIDWAEARPPIMAMVAARGDVRLKKAIVLHRVWVMRLYSERSVSFPLSCTRAVSGSRY